jgi:hypothetical protein
MYIYTHIGLKPIFSSAEVCDLSKHSASEFLQLYLNCTNLKILICGGKDDVYIHMYIYIDLNYT